MDSIVASKKYYYGFFGLGYYFSMGFFGCDKRILEPVYYFKAK